MTEHRPFRFDEHHVVLRLGEGEVLGRDLPGEAHRDGNLVSWDPGVDGLLAGAGTMRRSSSHKGERHLGGDELVWCTAGSMRVVLQHDDGDEAITVEAGEAFFVPRGVWHHIEVDDEAHFAFFGGGRTEIRLADA